LRNRVRSRSRWISSGGNHASHSDNNSRASNSASQRASSRSVFAPRRRPEQTSRLHRLSQTHVEAYRDELSPHPAPASRRLDRQRLNPTLPLLSPAGKAVPIGRETLRDHLTTVRIGHRAWNACLWVSIAAYNITNLL